MVGAKQLETRGLSWFWPGPYVQQWCARGTILLCTGVPVVGRLQARRERRRDLQVPGGVIKTSSDVVRELRSVCVVPYLMSDVPCGEGVHRPFIDQGGANYRHAALFSYTGKYGVRRCGVGGRPRSCRHNVSCTRTVVASRVGA
jgi:hypothetical protein